MTKQKSIKRALLMSALSLLMCVSMLIGSTFAWFTDAVTSGSNVFTAGNLDIVVEYTLDGTTWDDLDGAANLFQKGLWEPGHTEVVALRIKNNGTLALKYAANMNIVDETIGKTKDDADIVLSEILTVSTLVQQAIDENGNANQIGDITLGLAFSGESSVAYEQTATFKAGTVLRNDVQLLPGAAHYVIVKVDMPETVGNQANHNGTDIPTINFGIDVLATQFTYENDSFGSQYDKDSTYPVVYDHVVSSSAELADAFVKGGTIQLADDIALDSILYVNNGVEVYLDMNGKTITAEDSAADPIFYTYKDSTLTITGNGTVELKDPSLSLLVPGGDVVIENGTFVRDVPDGTPANEVGALFVGVKVSPWGSQSVTINGGYFDGGYYNEDAADIEELLAGTKTLEETSDDIAKRGNSKDANKVRVALKQNVQLTLNLSYNLFKVKGGTFVGMNPAWGDEGCMLPTTPNYLRPWSYYQGALIEGQTFNENGIVLPEGYSITVGETADGRPTYTVNYSE